MAAKQKPSPKKRGRKPILDPELVAAAIVELTGNVAAVARRFNVARASVNELISKRPSLQLVVTDCREGMTDNVESSLYRAALAGESWAVCFFLKTQAKHRGYVERTEPLPPLELLLASLPEDVRKVVKDALAKAVHDRTNSGGGHEPEQDAETV